MKNETIESIRLRLMSLLSCGVRQSEFAKIAGLRQDYISRFVRGKIPDPGQRRTWQVLDALDRLEGFSTNQDRSVVQ